MNPTSNKQPAVRAEMLEVPSPQTTFSDLNRSLFDEDAANDLPSWSTNGNLSIRTWLLRFETVARRLQASDEDRLDFFISKCHDDAAALWCDKWRSSHSDYVNWSIFKKDFLSEFEIERDDSYVKALLQQMFQKQNETLEDYSSRFKAQVSRAHSLDENEICGIFVETLLPGLRDHARVELGQLESARSGIKPSAFSKSLFVHVWNK